MRQGKRMPALPDTGRLYLDQTRRARLASPGIERFVTERSRTPWLIAFATVLAMGLVAAMIWLSRAG